MSSTDSKPESYPKNAKICQLVEQYPIMYDRSHPHYCKKELVQNAWVQIAKEMNDPVPVCKERWRNIRTSFARSINVNKKRSTRTKPYYLHEELKFLARNITPGVPVQKRSNTYYSGGEDSEAVEVSLGEESFDGFAANLMNFEDDSQEQCSSADEESEAHSDRQRTPSQLKSQVDSNEMNVPEILVDPNQPPQLNLTETSIQPPPAQLNETESQTSQSEQLIIPILVPEVSTQEPPVPLKKRPRLEFDPKADGKSTFQNETEDKLPDFDAKFLAGLLPEMKAMDFRQKIIFKRRIYETIEEIFSSETRSSQTVSEPNTGAYISPNLFTIKSVLLPISSSHCLPASTSHGTPPASRGPQTSSPNTIGKANGVPGVHVLKEEHD